MKDLAESKLAEYKACTFENPEFKKWLKDSNLWIFIYNSLRITGIELDKRQLVAMLDGEIFDDMPLDIYCTVQRLRDLYKEMQESLAMESLNEKLLNRFYEFAFGTNSEYRKDNRIIYKWGHIAPHFNDISRELNSFFRSRGVAGDAIERALYVHSGIARIYPFGDDTALMAIISMSYELMSDDVPIPALTADDLEYNNLLKDEFNGKEGGFSDMFCRSLLNRLDAVMLYGIQSKER